MRQRSRLNKLERARALSVATTPALLFLTAEGLRDAHNRPVDRTPVGVKVIVGIDPRDL